MKQNEHGYVYVIVRNDLSVPQKAVQSCHACIEVAREYIGKEDGHPSVIICVIRDENKLKRLIEKMDNESIVFKEFREPDIGNELTAIATSPLYGDQRKFFSRYQLLY